MTGEQRLAYLSLRHGYAVPPPSSEGGSVEEQRLVYLSLHRLLRGPLCHSFLVMSPHFMGSKPSSEGGSVEEQGLVYLSLRHGYAVPPPSSEGGSADRPEVGPYKGKFISCRGGSLCECSGAVILYATFEIFYKGA